MILYEFADLTSANVNVNVRIVNKHLNMALVAELLFVLECFANKTGLKAAEEVVSIERVNCKDDCRSKCTSFPVSSTANNNLLRGFLSGNSRIIGRVNMREQKMVHPLTQTSSHLAILKN